MRACDAAAALPAGNLARSSKSYITRLLATQAQHRQPRHSGAAAHLPASLAAGNDRVAIGKGPSNGCAGGCQQQRLASDAWWSVLHWMLYTHIRGQVSLPLPDRLQGAQSQLLRCVRGRTARTVVCCVSRVSCEQSSTHDGTLLSIVASEPASECTDIAQTVGQAGATTRQRHAVG